MPLKFSSPLPSIEGVSPWVGDVPTDADLTGKPVFVQFWAVWCSYCLMNAPLIAVWSERYSPSGLIILTVHAGRLPASHEGKLAEAIEEHDILTPCALDENDVLGRRFQTEGITPAYFFFDSGHRLRSRASGKQGLHLVEAAIRRSLGLSELVVGQSA